MNFCVFLRKVFPCSKNRKVKPNTVGLNRPLFTTGSEIQCAPVGRLSYLKIEFGARLNLVYSPQTQAFVVQCCLHQRCQVPNPSSPPDYPLPSTLKLLNYCVFLQDIFLAYHLHYLCENKEFTKICYCSLHFISEAKASANSNVKRDSEKLDRFDIHVCFTLWSGKNGCDRSRQWQIA